MEAHQHQVKPKVTIHDVNQEIIENNENSISQQILNVSQFIIDVLTTTVLILYAIGEAIYRLIVPIEEKSVKNEIVLITGTGHGIGKELALLYASQGATVVGWDLNPKGNEFTSQEITQLGYPKAHFYTCDVAKRDEVFSVAKKVHSEVGQVTILINNAGIMPAKPFLNHTKEDLEKIININVMAHFWILQAFLPNMIKSNKGHIVALSSCAGLAGMRNIMPYCASKFAVRGMMEGLLDDLRAHNKNNLIKTTVICPYIVDTGLCKKPRVKFQKLMPIVKPKEAARFIMQCQRTDVVETTIPSYLRKIFFIIRLLPFKATVYVNDFINTGVDSAE